MASSVIPGTGMISVVIKALVAFIVSNIIFLIIYARSKEFNYLKTVAVGFLRKKLKG
jgi:cell division protein FtsX